MSVDLRTSYLGLELDSPLVASASPLTEHTDMALRMEAAGAAAIVLPSLFEEEILHEQVELNRALEAGSEHFAEALDYFPRIEDFSDPAERYLLLVERCKAALSVPLIASLNGVTPGGWVRYATQIEAAGADALELNLYHVAADPTMTPDDVEQRDLELVAAVRAALSIPLAVKLSPYYSAFANFARRLVDAGADGLVLFNRFYQPDYDLESLDVVGRVELSTAAELRLPLRWIAILSPQLRGQVALAHSTGIHTGDDVVKALLAGADVTMLTSAILHHGPEHFAVVTDQLTQWLAEREYTSVGQLRGSASRHTAADPSAFERANYRRTLHSWTAPHRLTPSAPSPVSPPSG